jgi:hypothetical protein
MNLFALIISVFRIVAGVILTLLGILIFGAAMTAVLAVFPQLGG